MRASLSITVNEPIVSDHGQEVSIHGSEYHFEGFSSIASEHNASITVPKANLARLVAKLQALVPEAPK